MSSLVRSALVKAFMDLSTAEGWTYKIITENSPQEPDKNNVWIGLTYLPDVPEVITLGDGGEDDLEGILQLDIYVPTGKGEKEALDITDKLRSYLQRVGVLFIVGRRLLFATVAERMDLLLTTFFECLCR